MMNCLPCPNFRIGAALRLKERLGRSSAMAGLMIVGSLLINSQSLVAQTWTLVPQNTPSSTSSITTGTPTSTMLLLTDGSVMVHAANGSPSANWYRLRPDSNGDYHTSNITWSNAASMKAKRYMFESWVIPNGNLVVAGGLFTSVSGTGAVPAVEIYNPQTDTWTSSTQTYPGTANTLLNAPSVLLPNGSILFGDVKSASTYLYNPTSDSWSGTGAKAGNVVNTGANTQVADFNDGQAFTLLPSGRVLAWPIHQNLTVLPPAAALWAANTAYAVGAIVVSTNGPNKSFYYCVQAGTSAAAAPGPSGTGSSITDGTVKWQYQSAFGQQYNPGTGSWQLTAAAPSESFLPASGNLGRLTDTNYNYNSGQSLSLGPASVMPDGSVVQFGANGTSAIFSGGAWSAGPSFPSGGSDCAPGAMLPNGLFLVAADGAPGQNPPTSLYTYDYTTQLLTKLTGFPSQMSTALGSTGAANTRMLVLPNGHALFNTGNGTIWDFAPGGPAPLAAWTPSISPASATTNSTTWNLTGSLLTGISAGACYGANADSATNYPIVKLQNTSTGYVQYARTYGWTPQVHAAGDATTSTIQFDIPSNLSIGNYNLSVVANGIPSATQAFSFAGIITKMNMTYDSANQILTLTAADNHNHNVSVSLKNQILTVAGSTATVGAQNITTQIVYGTSTSTTQTLHFGTNVNLASAFTLKANFGSGTDYLTINGLSAKSVGIGMGDGNDTCTIYYSTINSGNINGGNGSNTFGQAASKISGVGLTNFQVQLPP